MISIRKYFIIIVFIVLGCNGANERDSLSDKSKQTSIEQSNNSLPTYVEIDRNINDSPIKTLLELNGLVSDSISESGLKQLLMNLHDTADSVGNFKFNNGKARLVYIYLFTSLDHYKSGWAQWIAMLSREGLDAPVDIIVRTELISYLYSEPEIRYGISESTRIDIYKAIILAEDRADIESQELFPLPHWRDQDYSQTKLNKQIKKQAIAMDSLEIKYDNEIAKLYNITKEQLDSISWEGSSSMKNWPKPPLETEK